MGLLPKNEPKAKNITPRMLFIWGQSMSGKTFLARQFPNPVIINTDGNAKKVDTPSVEVFDFETFVKVMSEIESGKHDFETVIIDLVDDIKTMLEVYVMKKYDIEALADAPFGKAFSDVKTTWKTLMVRLSQLPQNVIFISHVAEKSDDNDSTRMIEVPSLEQKFYNMTMGRCDLSIKCRKLGQTYHQMVVDQRDSYKLEDLSDKRVADILVNIRGAISNAPSNGAKTTAVKKPTTVKKSSEKVTTEKTVDTGHDPSVASNAPSAEPETTPLQAKAKKQLKPLKTS